MISLRPLALGLVLLAAPGCVIDDIDISNRRCPCIEGWVCDPATDRCVLSDAGGATADATVDGPIDSGAIDSGPIDSGPPPPTCDTIADAIFCEDFESGGLARWTSIVPSEGGSIAPSSGAARVGGEGLRITAAGGASPSRLTAAIDSGDAIELHFRAWVYVPSTSVGPIELFTLEVAGVGEISAQMLPADRSYVVQVAPAGAPAVSDAGRSGRWNVGEWTCVRGRVVRGEGVGLVEILDAPPQAASLAGVDTEWGAPFDAFSVALSAGSTGEVRLDDVMWTRAPLACP